MMVTREDLERAAWAASGWSVDQSVVDELLAVAERYAQAHRGGDLSVAAVVEVPVEPVQAVDLEAREQDTAVLAELALELDVVTEPVAEPEQEVPEGSKVCTRCRVLKTLDQFGKDRTTRSGYKPRCKKCLAAVKRDWKDRQRAAASAPDPA